MLIKAGGEGEEAIGWGGLGWYVNKEIWEGWAVSMVCGRSLPVLGCWHR